MSDCTCPTQMIGQPHRRECPANRAPDNWGKQLLSSAASGIAIDEGPALYAATQREEKVRDLEAAAIQLRDAELALKAARENYGAKLRAFNEFVAPVAQ